MKFKDRKTIFLKDTTKNDKKREEKNDKIRDENCCRMSRTRIKTTTNIQ